MKLIVGLGNPGKIYEKTRHNIGFMIIDNYIKNKNINISFSNKFAGNYIRTKLFNEDVIFLKPQSYINLSGNVVKKFSDYYKININDILIIHDDMDIDLGKYKLKQKGSSGGHNGLKNIELEFKSQNYKRLKIGISKSKLVDTKDYVLGNFTAEEIELLSPIIKKSIDIISDYLCLDFNSLMNKYN